MPTHTPGAVGACARTEGKAHGRRGRRTPPALFYAGAKFSPRAHARELRCTLPARCYGGAKFTTRSAGAAPPRQSAAALSTIHCGMAEGLRALLGEVGHHSVERSSRRAFTQRSISPCTSST